MPDFSIRSSQTEMMDDLQSSGDVIGITLRELERINLLLGGNHVTLDGIDRLVNGARRELTIADVGCGSGDILRLIEKRLRKKKIKAQLLGVDANPSIVQYATAQLPHGSSIQFKAVDIFSAEFRRSKFDIVTGTLFFHHFTDEQLIDFFRALRAQLSTGLVINDIHRHWFAYHSIKWLTRIFSRSPMVIHDAPVSVMRAFSKKDLERIMRSAGYEKFTIRWMWAFRWQVIAYIN